MAGSNIEKIIGNSSLGDELKLKYKQLYSLEDDLIINRKSYLGRRDVIKKEPNKFSRAAELFMNWYVYLDDKNEVSLIAKSKKKEIFGLIEQTEGFINELNRRKEINDSMKDSYFPRIGAASGPFPSFLDASYMSTLPIDSISDIKKNLKKEYFTALYDEFKKI